MNYALQPMSKEEFIRLVTADQPDAPQYFTYDAILNTRERVMLDSNLERVLQTVALDEVIRPGRRGRAAVGCAGCGGICQGAPGRQHQHRTGRPIRHMGRHTVGSRRADCDYAKSLVPYRQCSAAGTSCAPTLSVRSSADTAICSKVLAR
jgi:hypothetical protein